jgi:hypothetical protein
MSPFEVDSHYTELIELLTAYAVTQTQRNMANGDSLWANMEGHDLWDDLRSSIVETRSLRRELRLQTAHFDERPPSEDREHVHEGGK